MWSILLQSLQLCHSRIVSKLSSFGFNDSILKFLPVYFDDRRHYVEHNDFKFINYNATSDVPRGSNIILLLLLLFLNHIGAKLNA